MSTPTLRRSRPAPPAPLARALAFCCCLGAYCLLAAVALAACSREPDLDEVFAPPRPIGPSDTRERPGAMRYEFAAGSELEFRVGPRSGRARGRLALVGGGLTVDSFDLALTRGHAVFDLRTIELEDDAPAGVQNAKDPSTAAAPGSLTERALSWLELDGAVPSTSHPEYRYARFTIRSVGALGATSAASGERLRSEASRPRRRVRLDASGELELHGVRFPYTAPLDAIFEWNESDPAANGPSRIEIATREAVGVDLGTHAIVPRRPGGEVDAEALSELRKGSGLPVSVTAHWVVVPATAPVGP